LPLPQPRLLSPAVMLNVLGQHVDACLASMPTHPSWHYHLYGKGEARYARKMGHITALCDDTTKTLQAFERSGIWTKDNV
jgi:phosphoribosylaminoimidazole carboxylase